MDNVDSGAPIKASKYQHRKHYKDYRGIKKKGKLLKPGKEQEQEQEYESGKEPDETEEYSGEQGAAEGIDADDSSDDSALDIEMILEKVNFASLDLTSDLEKQVDQKRKQRIEDQAFRADFDDLESVLKSLEYYELLNISLEHQEQLLGIPTTKEMRENSLISKWISWLSNMPASGISCGDETNLTNKPLEVTPSPLEPTAGEIKDQDVVDTVLDQRDGTNDFDKWLDDVGA